MSDNAPRVAIVGMAGRFPGARDTDEFWANLVAGRESITQLDAEQLRAHEPELETLLGQSNFVTARGLLDDIDLFDAPFFGIPPREAATLDPQQRLWLETAWSALEGAGVDPARFDGPIGVFAGAGYMEQYLLYNLLQDREYIENLVKLRAPDSFAAMIANDKDYLPTRTAYKFNLRGPAINVQTACSSSLVAVHLACQSLLAFESDLAIAGAVSIGLPQERGYLTQEGGMLSEDGHCRVFDEKACGTVFSSGLGAFVLKRYEEAVDAGDDILAVIRGSAINNDGADKVSFGAPSPAGQAEVVAMAQAVADVHPDDIGYVEAHGTATPLGDPIEIDGLTRAWRRKSQATGGVLLGAVKSNIGHLDSAAGAAGMVKTIHALRQGRVPATLHYEKPNPRIDFESSPFRVVSELTDWPRTDSPRLAGLSSFGVGGTNAHVVLEQAPALDNTSAPSWAAQLLVLSAKTPTALARRCSDLADWLQANDDIELADVAWTLATGRAQMAYRGFVVADSVEQAVERLRAAVKSAEKRKPTEADQPPLVFLFPGQGAQHPGMGKALYDTPGVFRDTVDRLADYLQPELGLDIRELLYPPAIDADAEARLRGTGNAQPALFVVQLALARLWESWGIAPESMLGHSVGEYVAACLAGVFSEQEVCRVLAARARFMADMPGGSMLALRRGEAEAAELLSDDIALAAVNGPQLSIVSGPDAAIDALAEQLAAKDEETIRLHTSHAFHSPMMDGALAPFEQILREAGPRAPERAFVSCVTGDWITSDDAVDPAYWARQLRQTVRFSPALGRLLEEPAHVYLECGPSQNLTAATRQHKAHGRAVLCIPSAPHASSDQPADQALLAALGQLWQAGVTPDWSAVWQHDETPRRILHLPTYPFERKRYWVDAPTRSAFDAGTQAGATAIPTIQPAPEPTAAAMEEPVMTTPSRKEHVTELLRDMFLDLSGIEIGPEDESSTFPGMGMDSLFLTQAAAEVSKTFGIALRFRQLLDDINSLALLAEYIDGELAPDAFQPPAAAPTAPTATPQPDATPAAAPASAMPAGDNANTRHLIEQQLDVMRRQLALMGGQSNASAAAPAPATTGLATTANPATNDGPTVQATIGEGEQGRNLAATSPGRFGPYKTINHERDGSLTAAQQSFLDDLVATLNRRTAGSKRLATSARQYLADPRGVANFRRAWKELVYQIVADETAGARMTDIDGNDYIDITMGFGVGFMGHRHPVVVDAIDKQLGKGFEVGPQTPLAPVVAEKFCKLVGHDRVTFCNTGSEGVMAALRCARTVTGRTKIVYFTGDYHGTFDEVLARANIVKGELTTRPVAPGIGQDAVDSAMVLDYGTRESLDIIRAQADDIAAVLVEPVQSRYPELQPSDFVRELREITADAGTALILDEVITGFRVALGGIKQLWDIDADMCAYGKVLGGGLPIGALAGKARWLDAIDGGAWQYGDDSVPEAPVTFFAGTFVRHPLVMAAADAVLDFLAADAGALQRDLNDRTEAFAIDMNRFFEDRGAPVRIRQCSSWFRFDIPNDQPFANLLFYYMAAHGVYIREAAQNCFFSIAHTDADIGQVARVVREGTAALQAAGFLGSNAHQPTPAAATGTVSVSGTASAGVSANPAPAPLAVGESIALTEAQREIWLAQTISPEAGPAFNELFYADLVGELDVDAFRTAVQQVAARHEALQLRFAADGESQTRVAFHAVDVPITDLSDHDAPEYAAMAAINAMSRTDFDLTSPEPLLRFQLFALSARRTLAAIVVQHMVCDGWSSVVFLEELGQVYSALVSQRTPSLPPPVPFSVYARRQAERADAAADERAYWVSVLADPPPPLTLPTRQARPANKTFAGATVHHAFDTHTLKAARKAAADGKVTAFSLLLAAYAVLLTRLADQHETVIAISVAGQALEGENELFGHCVQTLPIRIACERNTAFSQVLAQVHESVRNAYRNADCTYGSILRELDVPRDAARLPLAEVAFNLDPAGEDVRFKGLSVDLHEAPKSAVNFDLFFNLTQGSDHLVIDCDYNTDLFDQATIGRWIQAYEALVNAAAHDPETTVGRLPMAPEGERHTVPADFIPAPLPFDDNTDLAALLRAAAAATPEARAIAHADGDWTYAQLDAASGRIAAALADQGVGPGDIVGVCLPRVPALIAGLIGVLKSGAAYLPMDPAYPRARLQYMASDSEAALILRGADDPELDIANLDIDKALAFAGPAPELASDASRPAYVIYTSGSTGQPKGVLVAQRNVLALLAWARTAFDDHEMAGVLASASVCFDFSVFEMFATLTRGGTLVLVDNLLALTDPPDTPITLVSAVPSAMAELLRHVSLPDSIVTVCLGGEPLSPALVDTVREHSRVQRVLDVYGPTECTVFSTVAQRSPDGARTIGRPLPNWRVYILDDQGRPAAIGERGELVIGGAGVTLGYVGRPQLTAERFVPDPFVTGEGARMYKSGDLACWRDDGQIEYLGRADDQIKLRGFRIELGEVQNALTEHPAVAQAVVAVQATGNGPGDDQLVAYWRAQAGLDAAPDPAELRRHLRAKLPLHMVPQQFVAIRDWPMLPNGKVDRARLPNPFAQAPAATREHDSTADELERITAIWSQLLGEIEPRPEDTFLDLGGHSLLAVRATVAIKREYDVDIPVRAMMLDSLAQLAARLGDQRTQDVNAAEATKTDAPPDARPARSGGRLAARLGFGRKE